MQISDIFIFLYPKGGNILISNDGSVKLADFGASKRVEAFGTDPDKMMEELTVRGTPYFMVRLPTYTYTILPEDHTDINIL